MGPFCWPADTTQILGRRQSREGAAMPAIPVRPLDSRLRAADNGLGRAVAEPPI